MSVNDPLGLLKKKNRKKKTEYFEPQWKSDIEHRELDFSVKTVSIRFNRQSSYVLQFTLIESFADNYEGVKIKIDDGEFSDGRSYKTPIINPVEIGSRFPFEHTVSFILPKGYCKNDGRHDVHLQIEAWEAVSKKPGDVKLTKLVGQSIYPVYPRPTHPVINLNAKDGRPMLQDNVILPLLRAPNTDQKVMHCGDVTLSVTIRDRTHGEIPMVRASTATGTIGDTTDRGDGDGATVTKSPAPTSPVPILALGDRQKTKTVLNSVAGGKGYFVGDPSVSQMSLASISSSKPPVGRPAHNQAEIEKKDSEFVDDDDDDVFFQVGDVIQGKPKKRQQFVSVHDIKYLKPDVFGKAVADGNSISSQLSHVAHPGTERIDVIIHSACSLPDRSADNNFPRPFVALSTTMGFLQNEIQSFTHISKSPGSCGTWEEMCTVEFDGVAIANEALVAAIVDRETLEVIACYSIPVTYLQPYQQYHLELLLPRRHGVKCRLYASIMRKLPQIPNEQLGPVYGVEVLLRHFDSKLSVDPGPLICVARIIPDYSLYAPITHTNKRFGIIPRRITFPLPKASAFIQGDNSSSGNAQVSLPGEPPTSPIWNYPFLFATERDKATVFNAGAALLLEFYQFYMQTNDAGWELKNPVGISVVPLDSKMFEAISRAPTSLGVCVPGIPVLSQTLKTPQGKIPTVNIALRLLSPHAVDTLATQNRSIIESLPIIDIHPFVHELKLNCKAMAYKYTSPCPDSNAKPSSAQILAQTSLEPAPSHKIMHMVPKASTVTADEIVEEYRIKVLAEKLPRPPLKFQLNEGELPPPNAMQSVLPEYRYLLEGGRGVRGAQTHILRQLGDDPGGMPRRSEVQMHAPSPTMNGILIPVNADAMAVAELDQYRRAVRRMGEDILALRREIATMSADNTRLTQQIQHFDDLTRTVISTQVIEGLSKAELADRYVASRQQLISQEEQLQQYKQRTQRLHNELIRKNDREVEGAHIRQAHATQQAIIQRLQDKASRYDKLVETVRHQELVIERMERVLTTRLKAIPTTNDVDVNSVQRDAYDSVVEENTQLRRQIEELRIINEATGQAQSEVDSERLQLMQAMDRMEARIIALEKELEDRSREWGRERAELVIKLNEQHRGFSPTVPQHVNTTRVSPISPHRGSFTRFTVAETGGPPPATAFPSLASLRNRSPVGVGGTLLGRARFGQS